MIGSVLGSVARLGRGTLGTVQGILGGLGAFTLFSLSAIAGIFTRPFRLRLLGAQLLEIGYFSLPVVGLTAAFSGLVLALQSYMGIADLASPALAEGSVARVVLSSLVQELGPVLAGLMVAGRIGAAMAAELGTMRVTEQIDALHTLGASPVAYLVSPRLAAAALMMPCLVLVADILGTAAGYLLATTRLELGALAYVQQTLSAFSLYDVSVGLTKALVFGILIALISCFQGYRCGSGAAGVGRAATYAVVYSSVAILASNYLITEAFFG